MKPFSTFCVRLILWAVCNACLMLPCAQATETFDTDPGWEGVNHRPEADVGVWRAPDFGYSPTVHAGNAPGEIGGQIARTVTPAYYGMAIPGKTLDDRLEASGTFSVTDSDGGGVLVGWFNQESRGWRTPNSLVFRIDGESNQFRVFFEYGTRHWKTGGGETFEGPYQTTTTPMHAADGAIHTWRLIYDPDGNDGDGLMTFVLDGEIFTAPLAPGHRADGAVFDRFGILNQQVPGGNLTLYIDALTIDGTKVDLDHDPGWHALGNRDRFRDTVIRPVHDIGHHATAHAGGNPGEIGGTIWRIESMTPEKSTYYAAPTGRLSLDDALHASGTIAMTAAAADSGVLIGWFNASTFRGAPPMNFLGVFLEGPSRIGHYFRPAFGSSDAVVGVQGEGPVIYADRKHHTWSLDYSPETSRIVVTLDGEEVALEVPEAARKGNAAFNRFGLLSWLRGGHFVTVYLDDLEFTRE